MNKSKGVIALVLVTVIFYGLSCLVYNSLMMSGGYGQRDILTIMGVGAGISLAIVPGVIISGIIGLRNTHLFKFGKVFLLGSFLGYLISSGIIFILEAVKVTCTFDCGRIFMLFLVLGLLNFLGSLIGTFITSRVKINPSVSNNSGIV